LIKLGFPHYFYREKEINLSIMKLIVDDFKKVVITMQPYVDLAGGNGSGEPEINYNKICFNGIEKCNHPHEDHGIAWPSDDAGGIANPFKENVEKGDWFGGAELQKRTCGGNCSHETMLFERIKILEKWDKAEDGLYFEFCKTAFKPYDLAVISLLIIAKHYLKNKIRVSSDGTDEQWFDGKMLCQQELNYGLDFKLDTEE